MEKKYPTEIYNTEIGKISVSVSISKHTKKSSIDGHMLTALETGGSIYVKEIKNHIKKYAKDHNINIDTIKHSIYGMYHAEILP